jgi:lipopolysaccharide transport system ATP-binding protein
MSQGPVIAIRGLGKRYSLGMTLQHGMLRDALAGSVRRLLGRGPSQRKESREFWALSDVSFDVAEGQVLGVIGRNGAGKTTLLKLLSRITDPTTGEIVVRGRVASLLEVGTGFHPELSGRENIFLNGAILGMTRKEIRQRFDEIVAFAEVERFIDTPVKRYSSGMYVRLAFAVAAHLDPEILVLDEVLAVGDYQFQKKCLGKMGDVARSGRTVLLVSHNMASVLNLCTTAVLLEQGTLSASGPVADVVKRYMEFKLSQGACARFDDPATAPGGDVARLRQVRVVGPDGAVAEDVDISQGCTIEICYENFLEGARLMATIQLMDRMGTMVLSSHNLPSVSLTPDPWGDRPMPRGVYTTSVRIPGDLLNEGLHTVNVFIQKDANVNAYMAHRNDVVSFTCVDTGAMRREYGGAWGGVVRPRLAWQTRREGE